MKDSKVVVGLDIGTTKICALVGVISPTHPLEIIGIGTHPSYGLKKGTVVNIDKTVQSISAAIEEAKLMAGVPIKEATIGVAGGHIYSFNSKGAVPIREGEVSKEDIDNVIETAKAVVIPVDREILHVIPQEFKVDNVGEIKNPIGMCGVRLEAKVHIVTGMISQIQNIVKCVQQSGIQVSNIILQPVASSVSVLTDEEREMGVVLVDIGGGTTDIAVWKDNCLLHSEVIPVGGHHFTNDLAVGLKTTHSEAERIKIHHGSVLKEEVNKSSHISIQGLSGSMENEVSLYEIATILEARAAELLSTINESLENKLLKDKINGGVILTGGGALIKGMPILSEYVLERASKIGYPRPFGGMTNIMQNPKYSTVLGLLIESSQTEFEKAERSLLEANIIHRLSKSIKNVLKDLF